MKDFLQYVFDEVKNQRLTKPEAIDLLRQFQTRNVSEGTGFLHPLLHQNTSDFSEQRFSSTFTGGEFFFADHVVNGFPVLPGVAYLEMARAAVMWALGFEAPGATDDFQTGIQLKNVVWIQPIVIREEPVKINLRLTPDTDGEILFEIYSGSEAGMEPVLHSQGFVAPSPGAELPSVNIAALLADCGPERYTSDKWYQMYKNLGAVYGPGLQGIEAVYRGSDYVLAKLSLPACVADTREQFALHPSLMDSAVQVPLILSVMGSGAAPQKFSLPFALEGVEIICDCPPSMWAVIRYRADQASGDPSLTPGFGQKVDIELCDEQGMICIRMKGFSGRRLEGEFQPGLDLKRESPVASSESLVGSVTLTPVWDPVFHETNRPFPAPTDQVVVVGGTSGNHKVLRQQYPNIRVLEIRSDDSIGMITEKLESAGSMDHLIWIAPDPAPASLAEDTVILEQERGVLQLFRLIKALLGFGYGAKDLGLSIITTQTQPIPGKRDQKDDTGLSPVKPAHAAVHGLIGSLAKEYPGWKIRLVDLEAGLKGEDWPLADILSLPPDSRGNAWGFRGGEWYRQKLIPACYPEVNRTLYKPGGVYVVIGGAGGLGEVWSEYMIRTYQARIIWIGRRTKDEAIQSKLEKLGALGPKPHYISADATDHTALDQAYQEIKQSYPRINGVIHSAIVLVDQSLANMEEERFRAGLKAKVDVCVRIAQVFQKESLDFMLFFSSMNSFAKAAGQSSYTSGCTFEDAFAHQLISEWPCAVRVVNWLYWGSVGVVASNEYQKRMAQAGIGSIEPSEAMEVLEKLLAGSISQIAFMNLTKSLVMEEIIPGESVTLYPQELPSKIRTIQNRMDASGVQAPKRKTDENRQIKEIEPLLYKLLWGQLHSIGLFTTPVPVIGARTRATEKNRLMADLTATNHLSDKYHKWLSQSMALLEQNEYLQFTGESYRAKDPVLQNLETVWGEWEQKKGRWLENPYLRAYVVLLEQMLRHLPEILTGKTRATDIMFPNSSMELVEEIYKHNPVADYFNEVLANTVVSYLEERLSQDPTANIKIIEIGAGTGGTSTRVFQKIKPYRARIEEYCYTDISKAFLLHAQTEYGPENPYLTYQIFNVEAPLAGQSIPACGYDILIATNVLHATRNIRRTLRNSKAALKQNGLLLLNEMSEFALFAHLTFGLLEGWWLYEDTALRIPGCPGLSPQTWETVLQSEGFQSVFFPAQKAHGLGQQIIVAESDGIVRQEQERKVGNITKPGDADANRETREKASWSMPSPDSSPGPLTQAPPPALTQPPKSMGDLNISDQMLQDQVKLVIREGLANVLKMAEGSIQNDLSFSEYGVDSIIAVNLVNLINKECHLKLQTTVLFDYSNVDRLARHIIEEHKPALVALLQAISLPATSPNDRKAQEEPKVVSREKQTQVGPVEQRWPKNRLLKSEVKTGKDFYGVMGTKPTQTVQQDAIAIIGMSGRFAKSKNVNDLWEHLAGGDDLIGKASRWDLSKYDKEGDKYCNYGSFLDEIDQFDPLFFNISGLEATYMEPQQRIFLEESWKALEDAGYAGTEVKGRLCGVYVGCSAGDYSQLFDSIHIPSTVRPPAQAFWGNAPSVIPARIAYYLDLQGPAIAVDTACSSSLVAIHLACQGLREKEMEMAIAGGVFLNCTPWFYLVTNRAGMLSPAGRCHTFDDRADGFVPGEGVGVVVLKRLQDAMADGDHIYGVIRGSGINQDGTTNGITAPSANSQERLERYVYDTYNLNPERIQMVEAHGTGTKLGDPIEFAALTRAFAKDTTKKEYCAIGSIKTNIGHASAAAGVAGLIKILLALKHRQIPPTLHFQSGNPNINFNESPFYVNTTLRHWEVDDSMTRSAALSSFGFSGTNAHMVIEEAPSPSPERLEEKARARLRPAYLMVISARTAEQLQRQAQQLVEFCRQVPGIDCGNMSYTLLLGRKHFDHRLACVIRDLNELTSLLEKWLDKGKVPQILVAELQENERREQTSLKQFGNQCLQNCQAAEVIDHPDQYRENLSAIADLYVQGYTLAFEQLFSKEIYSRISLPSYPFARGRYWVPEISAGMIPQSGAGLPGPFMLHPLLHQNTSDFSEQRFSSTFTGREFFLADHVVKGYPVLPGVTYLEMARAAVSSALGAPVTGSPEDGGIQVHLKNVVWIRPVVMGDRAMDIHIRLIPESDGEIFYEIYSMPQEGGAAEADAGDLIVHSQGLAALCSIDEFPCLNIEALLAECGPDTYSSSQWYELYENIGAVYGPGLKGVETVYRGPDFVLAKLTLPSCVSDTWEQFGLHPCLMDSAIQIPLILSMMGAGDSVPKPSLPFALEELEILGHCTKTMWAMVRYSQNEGLERKPASQFATQKLNIDLCNDQGVVCIRLKGFSARLLEGEIQAGLDPKAETVVKSSEPLVGTLRLTPVWDVVLKESGPIFPSPNDRVLIIGGTGETRGFFKEQYLNAGELEFQPEDTIDLIAKKLEANGVLSHIIWIGPDHDLPSSTDDAIINEQNRGVVQVFRLIKALLRLGYGAKDFGMSIITIQTQPVLEKDSGSSIVNPTHAGIHGLIGTLAKEYSNWKVRLIDLESRTPMGECWPVVDILTLPPDEQGNLWVYRSGEWYRQRLIPVQQTPLNRTMYKSGGVYVVIGGAGGLSEVWSEYMIRTYQARIIWIGRRERNETIQAKLDKLSKFGPTPDYISADATDKNELDRAYQEIKRRYSKIHGVIHAAIVLLDQSLANMEEERFQSSLAAKVDVSVRMAQVFHAEPLDFVMFFSSLNSFTKAPGQSNYTSGCVFEDIFARRLSQERPWAVKVVNWGYWGSIGIVASKVYQERMEQLGIGSIEPMEAMEALETLLAGSLDQIVYMKTTKPLALEGMNPGELITIAPENHRSYVSTIKNQLTGRKKSLKTSGESTAAAGNESPLPEQGSVAGPDSQIHQLKSKIAQQTQRMDELLCKLMLGQLQSLGLFTQPLTALGGADLKAKTGLLELYLRWLEESIACLIRKGYLKYDGRSYELMDITPIDLKAAWEEWEREKGRWLDDSYLKAYVILLELMLRSLPDILTGKVPATDLMFPNSSMKRVEEIYKHNPVVDYFNKVVADCVVAYIETRLSEDPAARIRMIEIGAGTGGTSTMVFDKLKPYQSSIEEYCYTDISKAFLFHAQQEYGPQNPFLTYQIFNVEAPLTGQDIKTGAYDLVIATNVLHATKNIRRTIRNGKASLKKHGLMILNEMSGNALIAHLTFGLLEGWWLYEDPQLRIPGCPGLYPETWQMILESEGLQPVFFPAEEARSLEQQIIVAESDGVIRQKQPRVMVDNPGLRSVKQSGAMKPVQSKAPQNVMPPIKTAGAPVTKANQKTVTVTDQMIKDRVRISIREGLANVLRIEEDLIRDDRSFSEYGVDSIIAVDLINFINKQYNTKLQTTALFDFSNITQLTQHIFSEHKAVLVSLFQENTNQAAESVQSAEEAQRGAGTVSQIKPVGGRYLNQGWLGNRFSGKDVKTGQSFLANKPAAHQDSIAIIGMSGRFAKSKNVNVLWENLAKGVDLVERASRWDFSKYYSENDKYCIQGSFLDEIDQFDPLFFNISGLEATYMDPQQRVFLEEAWKALEDSGYAGTGARGRLCGVYVGSSGTDYQQLFGDDPPAQSFWGVAGSVIPARVAYYLDLHGPAIAVDTACSSSLVAVHLACQGLWAGETEMALAGGVFIQSTPWFYLASNRAGMLSMGGHCHAFDNRADGFVPGEGAGVVVLKRLHEALADGDHIYGVIRGSGINQDGTTNGITAPSANSQERLECSVYDTFNINPSQIQMVEAHGTGTKLGDPIEFEALTRAFRKYTDKKEYCAIGSVKTNLGHAAPAAGIAGLIKILLALKHKQIPPSLHFKSGNSNINFKESPFYVNTDLRDWEVGSNMDCGATKRCAAVSSFGISGTNAHLVIEEAPSVERKHLDKPGYLIALSARTSTQLRQQVEQMVEFCEGESGVDCGNLSFTLLLGRNHLNHRLACVVRSQNELRELLKKWLDKGRAPQIYVGELQENERREELSLKQFGNQCLQNCQQVTDDYLENMAAIANLYVQGYELEFEELFANEDYARISLPVYPFAKESYWVSEVNSGSKRQISPEATAILHPLLHQNTSDFTEQRFSSTFTGREFFFADHVVKGQRMMPGVAYLEMARAAVDRSLGLPGEDRSGKPQPRYMYRLKNVVWARPIAVGDKPIQIHITLFPGDSEAGRALDQGGGEIAFEIYSLLPGDGVPEGENPEPVIHSQGKVSLHPVAGVSTVDLNVLQDQCGQSRLSAAEVYEIYQLMGIQYGPGHRGLEEIYVGSGQALAKLRLPASISGTKDQFVVHPGIVDAAIQAMVGLQPEQTTEVLGAANRQDPVKPLLPFALEEIEIFDSCAASMWAFIRYRGETPGSDDRSGLEAKSAGSRVRKLDIDVYDETGRIRIRIHGLSARVLEGEVPAPGTGAGVTATTAAPLVGEIMLTPVWETVPTQACPESYPLFPALTEQVALIGGTADNRNAVRRLYPNVLEIEIHAEDNIREISQKLEGSGFLNHIIWMAPEYPFKSLTEEEIITEQNRGALQVFRMIKALLGLGYGVRDLGLSIITINSQPVQKRDLSNCPVNPIHASIHGLIGSLAKEYANWKIRLVDLEANASEGEEWPATEIFTLSPDSRGNAWGYRRGEWYCQRLLPVNYPRPDRTLYRVEGVYVVIGGAGGIGEMWSEYLIRTYQARIIWIGRREKDEIIQAKIDKLAALGPAPCYIQADATLRGDLDQAYQEIKQRYSQIHGVIHSAIVLLDQSLANMEEERFRAGLKAKVDISVRLAQVFQKEVLDFVMFFSSLQSFAKAAGQSNYASGCTFKDVFAYQLGREWPCAVKVMNWGYWGSVGIVASKEYQERMAQVGIGSIEAPKAMEALEIMLAGPLEQVAFMKTTKPLVMDEIKPDELITVDSRDLPSGIGNIKNRLSDPRSPLQAPPAEGSAYIKGLEETLCKLLWGQLHSFGIFALAGPGPWETNRVIAEAKTKLGLRDLYERWLEESIGVLGRNNYLKQSGEAWEVAGQTPVDLNAAWNEWESKKGLWLQEPYLKAYVTLLEPLMRSLPDILTGKEMATNIMFPNSSMELVEEVYKNNPVSDYFNETLAETVVAYIKERLSEDPAAQIRMIEIGAGTGGTSTMVFRKIKPYQSHIQEYCYTDISKAFLFHAQKEYGPENPYLTFNIFNVEAPLSGQGISAGGYDLVIATNVIHATKNIRQTLRNAKATLKKNGLILLNEMSGNALFVHLTFGLLEGWWLYEDSKLRIPGCPGLYPKTWQMVLESEGFQSVFFPAENSHKLGQQIIVAQSDGMYRQKQDRTGLSAPPEKTQAVPAKKIPSTVELREQAAKPAPVRAGEISGDILREKSIVYIKKLVGDTLRIPYQKINAAEPMEKYGIDSILIVQLANSMSKVLKNITSTLFFEYQTIDALVDHFLKTQKDELVQLLGLTAPELPEENLPAPTVALQVLNPPAVAEVHLPLRKAKRFLQLDNGEMSYPEFQTGLREYMVQEIAIIGLSGRYPEAESIPEFWINLRDGKDCIREIPKERWDYKLFSADDKNNPGKVSRKWGGFLEGVDQFDPLFFNISPREAELMEPQERLFLQCVYETLEDAGYTRETICKPKGQGLGGSVGVFVGVMYEEYQLFAALEQYHGKPIAVFGNPSSIANRVSYFCNFQGPSMAIDTMCSSSLTAIHLACQSIRRGECEAAIAGGVNISIHPNKYLLLGQGKFFSSKGRCESFGKGGDGMVPGEGVGAVLLKPLSKAVADGDQIYGVIKATTVNHGGKTNGYSVPNPNAQAELIGQAFREAQIDPKTISYIEAHGTGTSLGDPIEIASLTKAFEAYTNAKQYCAIGSVKSNIGHCESAAGVAGVTKVLLQLKNNQLTPSLHSNEPNPKIDFINTPFVVQQELAEWKRPRVEIGGVTREYPRIAGISSFGAGGSNAHVLIEEYIPKEQDQGSASENRGRSEPRIIVLSAKTEDRLKEQARRLSAFIQTGQLTDDGLTKIAYTLQVGREAMEERLALLVESLPELVEKLKDFVNGKTGIGDLYRGQDKRNKEEFVDFTADEDLQKAIDSWIMKRKYEKILDLWVKGLNFDWNKLYGDTRPKRISLPTYPFMKERYWIPEASVKAEGLAPGAPLAVIHPLLHQNTSDLSEQRYSSTFTGQEFFLADHRVKGERVLPGVAYLEMARVAVKQATGLFEDQETDQAHSMYVLKNVAWVRPFTVGDQPARIHIGIYPEESGALAYEIYGKSKNDDPDPVVYCQGAAVLSPVMEAPTLDLPALRDLCKQNSLTPDECYRRFKAVGIEYGPGHQGIEAVYIGAGQVLAKLSLPSPVTATLEQFVLHPSMMDSALQAVVGLMPGASGLKPFLPFALEELQIFSECVSTMWALIRNSDLRGEGNIARENGPVQKFDIDLCDEQGKICIRMWGYSARVLQVESSDTGSLAPMGTLLLEPVWKERPADGDGRDKLLTSGNGEHLVILCEPGAFSFQEPVRETIETRMPGTRLLIMEAQPETIARRFESFALQVFEEIQNLLRPQGGSKPPTAGKILVQLLIPRQGERRLYSGLAGLLKTVQLENPKFMGQLIELEPGEDLSGLIDKLNENRQRPLEGQIRYRQGVRMATGWRQIGMFPEGAPSGELATPWKDQGIYLITGGAGGLGLIFAQEIAGKVQKPVLILTGRSALTREKKARLKEIEDRGARVIYRQVDVTDPNAVGALIENIREEFGSLSGIIHSAGVTCDNFTLKKTTAEFLEVLAPKVRGLENLDEATKNFPLDFFALFSSSAGSFGNVGQADYSTANAFMDAFAKYRTTLIDSKQRQGRTISINWPFWQEGGMRIAQETEMFMLQNMGMSAMPSSAGIRAFYQSLASGLDQVVVIQGRLQELQEKFLGTGLQASPIMAAQFSPKESGKVNVSNISNQAPVFPRGNQTGPGIDSNLLRDKTSNYFKKLLSSVIKLPPHRIEAEAPLEKYGIDSVMVMQLTDELEKTFGSLSKTLFYEYQSIDHLSGYFVESYREQLVSLLGLEEKAAVSTDKSIGIEIAPAEPELPNRASYRRPRFTTLWGGTPTEKVNQSLEIAIIGVSGRYPMAGDLFDFWKILRDGKDCITEIPRDRWDHSLYFDEDKHRPGKTYGKWGGFLEGVDQFDPLFFNISPREAEIMDPQERLFLQCVYETLEDAGYTRESLSNYQGLGLEGNIGVFVGVMSEEYQLYGAQEQLLGRNIALNGNPASIANRVSYFCNFHGPSVALDTMCSSSLTTIQFACQSIREGGCELAIAGGVNLSIHPNKYLALGQGKFVSSKGRCESFGQGGDGYVPGEGVGAVLLKPLGKAVADGDQIYGVVKGIAINHGGKTNGYTVPNPVAQAGVIRQALKQAGVNPRTISYIEAHGTGTSLGDPIEIAGLTKVFEGYTKDKQFCAIGSVKSNIGHCESAAGIAGVTKILLQLKNKQLVPSLHSEVLNPNIDFINSPFVVQQTLQEWKRPVVEVNGVSREYPRIAGISSFGAGGSNAHIVIEEYIPKEQLRTASVNPSSMHPAVVVLSAKNEDRLKEQAKRLLAAIDERQFTDANLRDLAYTLQIGREAMEERLGLLVGSLKELAEKLRSFAEGREGIEDLYRGQVKPNKEALAVFAADEELQEAVDKWIQRGKYAKLLELWVKGLSFDWNRLYRDMKSEALPRRISLPTYPFARERCWFQESDWAPRSNWPLAGDAAIASSAAAIEPLRKENALDFPIPEDISVLKGVQPAFPETVVDRASSKEAASPQKTGAGLEPLLLIKDMSLLTQFLKRQMAEILKINEAGIGDDQPLADLGLDSISMMELRNRINQSLKTDFSIEQFIEGVHLKKIATILQYQLALNAIIVSGEPLEINDDQEVILI